MRIARRIHQLAYGIVSQHTALELLANHICLLTTQDSSALVKVHIKLTKDTF